MKWEVRTMRSGTSFFNGTVYKKTFLRFWPIWAVNLVFWLLMLPLQGLMLLRQERDGGYMEAFARFTVSSSVSDWGGAAFALVLGLLAAMAVCSHLYSSRSANFMGALPIRREGLFLSHYLSGLTMLLAPNAAVFVLTFLVELAGGVVEWIPLLFWLAALSGMEFFFYSFAVCLGQFTGHLLALPVFYGVFNALAAAVHFLLSWVLVIFYYGYSPGTGMRLGALWLTPVLKLSEELGCDFLYSVMDDVDLTQSMAAYRVTGLFELGVYALAGLALTVCALLLYRRRHLETAGDVVAVRPMRPVFKYGVAVCAGLFFGYLTSTVLGMEETGLMIAIVLWGLAGYFVAQMLLDKSFRVFRKWKGGLAVTAAFLVLFLVVGFDLTGYETRVPDPSQVAGVEISGLGSSPFDGASWINTEVDDPAVVEKIVALHQAAVDHRELTEEQKKSGDAEVWNVSLTYTMKNGSTMTRHYSIGGWSGDADTAGTVYWAVQQLLTDRDLIWQAYGFDEAEAAGTLTSAYYSFTGGTESVTAYAVETGEAVPIDMPVSEATFYGADAAALLEAVKADFADGTIGVRQRWGYNEDRFLEFSWTQKVILGNGSLENSSMETETVGFVNIAVPDTAVRTIALLEELGVR